MWASTITDCVRAGNAQGVLKCLEAGGDIEERRSSNYTPLINAAYSNKCQMIELLLDRGANMEAVDRSGLSALRTAIYYGMEDAAVLLAQRGADANKLAYQQKTALYAAVEKRQMAVVKALLLNGADPQVKCGNHKSAIDLVNSGDLWVLLKAFTGLEMAIDSRITEAITFFLKQSLAGDESEGVLMIYETVKTALKAASGKWQVDLSTIVEQYEIDMLHSAVWSGSTALVDKVSAAVGKRLWVSTARLDLNGRNALHVAALLGYIALVSHLLENHKCDSIALDHDGWKAVDLVKENDEYKQISWILTEHEKKTRFLDVTSLLLEQNEVTAEELSEVPQFMTSIYDLRVLFFLGHGALTNDEMKQFLQSAFTEAVRMKLMFNDGAAVFFKTVLRECKRLGLISQQEKDDWKIKARHVNGENADWVRDIQNSLLQLEHRVTVTERNISSLSINFCCLRSALEAKIHLDDDRLRRRRLIGLVMSGLYFCGGPVMEGVLNWVFDSCEYAQTCLLELTETIPQEPTCAEFDVRVVLDQACIDQTEFADVLRSAISLEKAAGNADSVGVLASRQPHQPKLHFRDVAEMVKRRVNQESKQQQASKTTKGNVPVDHSHLTEEKLEAHPYHYVVHHSGGDLNEFKALVKYIDNGDGDVNATMEMRVATILGGIETKSPGVSPSGWKTVQAAPASYASYLGYVEIVEWFLRNGPTSRTSKEKSYVLINRARSIKKHLQSTTAA